MTRVDPDFLILYFVVAFASGFICFEIMDRIQRKRRERERRDFEQFLDDIKNHRRISSKEKE